MICIKDSFEYTPKPYLTFIVGKDCSVLAKGQQYRPIGRVGSTELVSYKLRALMLYF